MSKPKLIVFAKAPVPGLVKTRLMAGMSAQAAAKIYEQLLSHTLQEADGVNAELMIWRAGDAEHAYWQQWPNLHFYEQPEGDLGQKMAQAISYVNGPAIVIGSDCLELTAGYIECAIEALNDGVDVVLGPASDGGYVLIGMSDLRLPLFENIQWSSDKVLSQTLAAITVSHLSHVLLPELNDIDTVQDATAAGLFSNR